ncbi:MAG: hypothetical protein GY861_21750 [bacterium]|nr:hypothetical protein [bacterium]
MGFVLEFDRDSLLNWFRESISCLSDDDLCKAISYVFSSVPVVTEGGSFVFDTDPVVELDRSELVIDSSSLVQGYSYIRAFIDQITTKRFIVSLPISYEENEDRFADEEGLRERAISEIEHFAPIDSEVSDIAYEYEDQLYVPGQAPVPEPRSFPF